MLILKKQGISFSNLYWCTLFIYLLILCTDADNGIALNLCIIIMVFLTVIKAVRQRGLSMDKIKIPANMWNYGFFLMAILSVIWSISRQDSIRMVAVILDRVLVIFTLCVNVEDRKRVDNIMHMFLVACFCMMLKLTYYMEFEGITGAKAWDTICGNYFNTVAQILAIAMAMACYFMMKEQGKKRIIYILFIIFSFYHIYITGSRKGLLMPIVEFIIFKVLENNKDGKKIIKTLGILCMLAVVVYLVLSKNPELLERLGVLVNMVTGSGELDVSTTIRLYYIDVATQMFLANPILGQGINSFAPIIESLTGRYVYSHNNYTEIASNLGMIGFSLYYWFYLYCLYKMYKKRFTDKFYLMGYAVILTLMVMEYGIVTYSIPIYPILLTILSLPLSLSEDTLSKGDIEDA